MSLYTTLFKGSRVVRGHGGSHDEATRALRDEIQNILTAAKIKVNKEDMVCRQIFRLLRPEAFKIFCNFCTPFLVVISCFLWMRCIEIMGSILKR